MFKTQLCKRCGKMFIPAPQHLYKLTHYNKTDYYCSYNCWRKDGGDNGGKYRRI